MFEKTSDEKGNHATISQITLFDFADLMGLRTQKRKGHAQRDVENKIHLSIYMRPNPPRTELKLPREKRAERRPQNSGWPSLTENKPPRQHLEICI
jgi:hypothetical protein